MSTYWDKAVMVLDAQDSEKNDCFHEISTIPIPLSLEIAKTVGVRESMFVGLVYLICREKERNPSKYQYSRMNGAFWAWGTEKELAKLLGVNDKTISRIKKNLKNEELLLIEKPNLKYMEPVCWYRIDRKTLKKKFPETFRAFYESGW